MSQIFAKLAYELSVPQYRAIESAAAQLHREHDNRELEELRLEFFQHLVAIECEQQRRKHQYQSVLKDIKDIGKKQCKR